jgi:hypothetical protein
LFPPSHGSWQICPEALDAYAPVIQNHLGSIYQLNGMLGFASFPSFAVFLLLNLLSSQSSTLKQRLQTKSSQ